MAFAIMIQGTSSGVGKSIITTGICRILANDGHAVTTFKAQNMSNNAHVLDGGLQMARSQAIAAYACKKEPDADMNPILLKITGNGSEVFLNGKPVGVMDTAAYRAFRETAWEGILNSYNRLSDANDFIVIEGAGSPVELNLKDGDVVNMGLAAKVSAPVLLVADIDRGGVFASVYGTLKLFTPEERAYVKGVIINKCKGRLDLFADVKAKMEELTGLPVLGMVPYTAIDIEDEDDLIDAKTGHKTAKDLAHMNVQFDALDQALRNCLDMELLVNIAKRGV